MQLTPDLPEATASPSSYGPPPPGPVGTKPKAARCLGLAPPPRPASAQPTNLSGAGNGEVEVVSRAAATKTKVVKPPHDHARKTVRKRAAGKGPTPPAAPVASMAPPSAAPTPPEPEPSQPAEDGTDAVQMFDGMPPSMDDETFVDATFGSQLEFVQEEEEGFVEQPIRRGRGTNFSLKEDETLCNAWRRIGVDPIVGNEQQSSTYWDRIHELYTLLLKGDMSRTADSLQHRFHTINTDCFKWSCCLAQVDRLNPCGTNVEDKINIAQNLFMGKPKKKGGKPGKPFTLHHCWKILENDEKWKNRPFNEIPNKRKAPSSSVGEGFAVDSDDDGSHSPTPLSSVNRDRPDGRKKAKNNRLKGGEEGGYKESLDNMMEVRKDIAMQRREMKNKEMEERREAMEERRAAADEKLAEIEERKVVADEMAKRMENEQRIMFMDPNGLDEKGRAYLELCRDQILASRGYYPSNGGNGGNDGGAI